LHVIVGAHLLLGAGLTLVPSCQKLSSRNPAIFKLPWSGKSCNSKLSTFLLEVSYVHLIFRCILSLSSRGDTGTCA